MAEPIPIQARTLAEVTVSANDAEAIERMHTKLEEGLIPVYVLSAAGVELGEGKDMHTSMFEKVRSVVEKLSGEQHEAGPRFDIFVNPGRGGDAGLHADNKPSEDAPEAYHVLTTEGGEAHGSFAKPGPELTTSDINERFDPRLNDLFAQGMTDPGLMDPAVFSGQLKGGDTAVFNVTGSAPGFHNIETVSDERYSSATLLRPVPAQPVAPQPATAQKMW